MLLKFYFLFFLEKLNNTLNEEENEMIIYGYVCVHFHSFNLRYTKAKKKRSEKKYRSHK